MSGNPTRLELAVEELLRDYPLIAKGLSPQVLGDEPGALAAAEHTVNYAWRRSGENSERFSEMLEAFALLSFDFLRLQAKFNKTGRYALSSADGLSDDLYSDGEEMLGRYIEGLLLSYAMWPNHARILDFFKQRVVGTLTGGSRVREIGVGHGLMAEMLLSNVADLEYIGIDLSPHTITYCKEALAADLPDNVTGWDFVEADATDVALANEPGDWFVCSEVLEHVNEPQQLLASCRALIHDDGRGFLTTVANLEAEDHVYLFNDADHIRSCLNDGGFEVVEERALVLPGSEDKTPLPLNYAAIVAPKP